MCRATTGRGLSISSTRRHSAAAPRADASGGAASSGRRGRRDGECRQQTVAAGGAQSLPVGQAPASGTIAKLWFASGVLTLVYPPAGCGAKRHSL
jgi:hypothetical protein